MAKPQVTEQYGVRFLFVRRRYSNRTFTWVNVMSINGTKWEECGDPWPSVVVPQADLHAIAEKIKAGLSPVIPDARNRGAR